MCLQQWEGLQQWRKCLQQWGNVRNSGGNVCDYGGNVCNSGEIEYALRNSRLENVTTLH